MNSAAQPLLLVRRLRVRHEQGNLPWGRQRIDAVEDLHLDLFAGETLGLVGEPGAGKSSLAAALTGALKPTAGSIRVRDVELSALPAKQARELFHTIQAIDGTTPESPLWPKTLSRLLGQEARRLCPGLDADARERRIEEALASVELTGMQRRKIASLNLDELFRFKLACALLPQPSVLICDEVFSGIERADRPPLVELLRRLQIERGHAMLLLSRDLTGLAALSRRVAVMYLGRIVEQGPTQRLLASPAHPFTRLLLAQAKNLAISAEAAALPAPGLPPMGCAFHPRCALAEPQCVRAVPHMRRISAEHFAACIFSGGV